MALRLTGTLPDAPVSADDRDLLADILARASAALREGDLDAYHGCFAACAELADPQRRYLAEVRLVEHGLAHAGERTEGAAIRVYASVVRGVLEVLERTPAEPELLNYAAVACYELWALDAARTLFVAARRLDPGVRGVERNLSETARRARGHRPRRPLHACVPPLARRAREISARAQPARGLTVSLCMIVRDEEAMLPRCLQAAAPAVDEIVIVDTGSRDRTREIARSFGARVIEREWTGSFAEARNASFDAATGDWLLYLDADEVLHAQDAERLRALAGRTWREAFSFIETSFTGDLDDGGRQVNSALRMLRNRPEHRFEGRIHEQIGHRLPSWAPGRIEPTSIRIDHYGYLDDVRAVKAKSERNIALLREQARAEGAPSAFTAFNLGCEYAAAGQNRRAVAELGRAWELLETDAVRRRTEYAPALCVALARALSLSGAHADAFARAGEGLALFADATDLVLARARAARALGRTAEAIALWERCLELGDAPARHGGAAGAGTTLPRLALAREALAGANPAGALALLEVSLDEHPGFAAVAAPWASARIALGAAAGDVVAELEDRLDVLPPVARRELARVLAGAGAGPQATDQLQRALLDAREADRPAIRAALAELALSLGDWTRAAENAAAIDDEDPRAPLAARIEACARIVLDDEAGAREALRRASRTGVPEAECDALAAWLELAGGGAAAELGIAGTPLLITLAEMMLGAGEAGRFAQLRTLLEHSRLPARERIEAIAEMQRRHGALADAAQAWLAVCAERPDARARLGLARVALAGGMPEDAAVFAREALALDPGCAGARALLTELDG